MGGDANKCAVWSSEQQTLWVKGNASRYIPALKGEQSESRVTFYSAAGGPLVEGDVAELSTAETWLPRWAYAVCARAEKLKSLGEQRQKLKAAERAWVKKQLEARQEEERLKQAHASTLPREASAATRMATRDEATDVDAKPDDQKADAEEEKGTPDASILEGSRTCSLDLRKPGRRGEGLTPHKACVPPSKWWG